MSSSVGNGGGAGWLKGWNLKPDGPVTALLLHKWSDASEWLNTLLVSFINNVRRSWKVASSSRLCNSSEVATNALAHMAAR